MPVGQRYDYMLNGKGFMLARGQYKGRAWQRTGTPDTPGTRTETDAKYGAVADQLDHPEVWDDWSGGFGQAYRRAGENTYHWAENFDARFPRQLVHCQALRLIADTLASPTSSDPRGRNVCVEHFLDAPPRDVLRPPPGTGVVWWLGEHATEAQPTGLASEGSAFAVTDLAGSYLPWVGKPAIFGSFIFVGMATGNFQRITLFDISYGTGDCNAPGVDFVTAGGRLWRSLGTNYRPTVLRSLAAGADSTATANWSASLGVGTDVLPIQDLMAFEDQVFVGMPNGLYAGDQSGTFVNVLEDLSYQTHYDNCRDIVVHNGQVIVQHVAGVFSYQPNDYVARVAEIGPPVQNQRGPIQGMVRCLRGFGPWLYAGLWTGSQSHLLVGEQDGRGYRWHTQQRLPHIARVHRLHFDGITTSSGAARSVPNRLWVATDASIGATGTAPIYYLPVPRLNGNPLAPDPVFSANYVGSARIDLGAVDGGAPSTLKVYRSVELWADNLASAAQWCDVYYTVDGLTRAKLGTVAQSPKSTLYFPAGDPAQMANLCSNPGLEAGTTGWTASDVTMAQSAEQAHGGTKSLKLTGNVGGQTDAYAVNTVTGWVPGQRFTVTAWIYVPTLFTPPSSSGLRIVLIDFVNGVSEGALSAMATVAGQWQQLTVSKVIRQGTGSVAVRLYLGDQAGTSVCYFDDVLYTTPTMGQSIALSLESFTASAGVTPIYRSVVLRGATRPKSIDQVTAVTRIADNMLDRQGGLMRPGAVMLGELRQMTVPDTGPVPLVDLTGAAHLVSVLPPVDEQEVYQQGSEEPEVAATVRLAVLSFSGA